MSNFGKFLVCRFFWKRNTEKRIHNCADLHKQENRVCGCLAAKYESRLKVQFSCQFILAQFYTFKDGNPSSADKKLTAPQEIIHTHWISEEVWLKYIWLLSKISLVLVWMRHIFDWTKNRTLADGVPKNLSKMWLHKRMATGAQWFNKVIWLKRRIFSCSTCGWIWYIEWGAITQSKPALISRC